MVTAADYNRTGAGCKRGVQLGVGDGGCLALSGTTGRRGRGARHPQLLHRINNIQSLLYPQTVLHILAVQYFAIRGQSASDYQTIPVR